MAPSSERPAAGSWLDRSAARIVELLIAHHGLSGSDVDTAYLALAKELRDRRDFMAFEMEMPPTAVERYFDDDAFTAIAERVAGTLADGGRDDTGTKAQA